MATTNHLDDKNFSGTCTYTGTVTMTSATLTLPGGSVDPENMANPVRTATADAAVVIANTDHYVLISTTGAGTNAITETMDDGQVVHISMTAQATGTYEMTVNEGTLTFNAADESATIIHDGTDVRVMALRGATIV